MMTVPQLIHLLAQCDPAWSDPKRTDAPPLVVMTAHNSARDVVRVEEVQPGLFVPFKSWAGGRFRACSKDLRNAVCLWPPPQSRRYVPE